MDDSFHEALCPECHGRYDFSSLATHLCLEHGFCPFCPSEKYVTEDLYPELTCTRKEVVGRLAHVCRKMANDLLAPREAGFSLEACSSIYSTYIVSFSLFRKFPYNLPSPVSMLVHLIIEHPAVGHRLLCSLSGAESLVAVYIRASCSELRSQGDAQLCPDCFLFYTDAASHHNQCKGYYRYHFRHYLHYQGCLTDYSAGSMTPIRVSARTIVSCYFCPGSLKDNLDCARHYMNLYTPVTFSIAKGVEDNLRGYFTRYPVFKSLDCPDKTYKIKSLELQGSYAFGKATIYSDIDFHLLILKSEGVDMNDLTSEDTRDCLSSLIMHLQAPSANEWLSRFSVDKPIKYCRNTTGFIEFSLKNTAQSVSLVFGDQHHLSTGRRRLAIMRSFYLDKFTIYERAEAFLKQWLFMSRTTEGSTAMGLTKFASLTILQRVCLFTNAGSLLRRFICYDPSETYKAMLDPPSVDSITLYQCNYDVHGTTKTINLAGLHLNPELVDPVKFKQLAIDHCVDNRSTRDILDAILQIADTPGNISFIWVFTLIHEVLRYHRDFYQETLECKLKSNQEVSTTNILYNLRDLLSISNGSEPVPTEARTCVSVHVIKTMTLACAFRILLTVETSMLFLRHFLPTPPHCSTTDREALRKLVAT
ncbi:Hypothetical protein GLP15_2747 [Giardia lamblia P15]|uniref:Uncharacterized protein n=1 Tax=Giardia intestinalis (strain P15) TaxID=658858 RepID=E1F0W6_GIAIA|nr:Hypothetical protein GLP15_2747 [Giardia lamblia P15]